MYCYHCGKKIYNEMTKCPFCENKLESFTQNMFMNTLKDIACYCPDCRDNEDAGFQIGDKMLRIPKKAAADCAINRFAGILLENICGKISEYMHKNTLGTIMGKGAYEIQSCMMDATYTMLAFLQKNGELKVSYDEIIGSKYGLLLEKVDYICEPIRDAEAEYEENTRDIRFAKASKLERKSAWVGFGKGIAGGIQAALTAKIMNTATDVLLNAGSATLSGMQKLAKAAVLTTEEGKKIHPNYIVNVMKNIREVMDQMKNFLHDEIAGGSDYLLSHKKVSEKREYVNADEAYSVLQENPLSVSAYAGLYGFNREYGPQLLKLAEYCGLEIEVLEKFIKIDAAYLKEKQYTLDKINLDTEIEKVKEIGDIISTLEECNPVYRYYYPITDHSCVKMVETERKIRKETDRLLILDRVEHKEGEFCYKLVRKNFEENRNAGMGKTLEELLQKKDEYVNDAVYRYLQEESQAAWKEGKTPRQFLEDYKGHLYPIVYDGLLESWYRWNRRLFNDDDLAVKSNAMREAKKYAGYIIDAAEAGRVYSALYFSLHNDGTTSRWSANYTVIGYLSKERRCYYISKAARRHCVLAWPIVGAWYEEGSNGYEKSSGMADIYAYNTARLYYNNKWAVYRLRKMEKMKVYS